MKFKQIKIGNLKSKSFISNTLNESYWNLKCVDFWFNW